LKNIAVDLGMSNDEWKINLKTLRDLRLIKRDDNNKQLIHKMFETVEDEEVSLDDKTVQQSLGGM
jgi:hypothetical protein